MNKIILYIVSLILLFSILHYMVFTSIPLTQLDLSVPIENNYQQIIVNRGTESKRDSEIHLNITSTYSPPSISRGKDKSLKEEGWLHKILGVILSILSAISMFIKFLIDLTVIRVPQPSINETSINGSKIVMNPLHMFIVLLLSVALTITLLLYLSRSSIKIRKRANSASSRRGLRLGSLEVIDHNLDFKDIRSAIITSFQHLYYLARDKLGLDEAKTPREIALEFEKIALGDEAWLIVSAFEELKYGDKMPEWLTLKDLREAVSIIDGKIMKWSNQ